MRTLLLDIETAPNLAYVWGLRNQDISLDQLIEASYVLCWSAKWEGQSRILFDRTQTRRASSGPMIRRIHCLIEQADHIVTHNGIKFDLPTLNKEFLLKGLSPPAPAHYTDTLLIARSRFRFMSNRLDYLAQKLGIGQKMKHDGMMLWVRCMEWDRSAWVEMERYNKNDVVILEGVYHKLKPWSRTKASQAVRNEDQHTVCPNCGSDKYQYRGFSYSLVGKYARRQCLSCRGWYRLNVNELERGAIKAVPL